MPSRHKSIFKTYPLVTRSVIHIMGFGLIVALITSLIHLWFSYSLEIKRLKAKLDHLENEQIALLTNSLWSFDRKSIHIQLKSILSDTDIVYVEIKKGSVIEFSAGDATIKEMGLKKTYPLIYQNKFLGDANFFATSKNIKKRLIVSALGSLIAQVTGIFLICFFMAVIVFLILTKPISQILKFTKTIKLDNLDSKFSLNRTNKKPDEFDMIADTLDNMRQRLKDGIGETQRIQKELISEQTFTQNALNAQQDTFFLFEPETGKAIRWNKAFSKITGYSDDEIAAMKAPDSYYSTTDLEKAAVFINRVFDKGSGTVELNLRCKDGHTIPTEYSVSTINDAQGNSKYLISIGRELTERKKLEDMIIQSEKMHSVGGLAAGMAHEINNPLAGVIQNTSVLSSRLSDKTMPANIKAAESASTTMDTISLYMEKREIPRMLTAINNSGQRIASIVENMLSFARKSDTSFSTHNPVELVDKALELASTDFDLKKQYDFKSISIQKEYEDNLPYIACEGSRIQQVLLNILSNGAYAMYQTPVKANPRFILRLQNEALTNMLRLEIEDNGPGMDKETCKRIFEPFFTTKPVGVGTGLGLSVSYFIIVKNHKGTLKVVSEPGKGTNFIVRLPVEKNLKTK